MTRIFSLLEPFVLMLLGTVVLASVLPARGGFIDVIGAVSTAAIVLLFFLHGAKLSRQAIVDGVRHWQLHLATLAVTFVLFPVLGLAIAQSRLLIGPLATGMLFLTLVPSTVQSSIAFTALARGNVASAVCSASFSNLIGVVLTPLLVAMLMGTSGPGVSGEAALSIVTQLLLPFAAGHAMRPVIGSFIAHHKPIVSIVDRGSILLVVYVVFGAAVREGLWSAVRPADLAMVAAVCAALLAIVLLATRVLGRVYGFSREDTVVLMMCGSKKSLASGVPMAGVLFPAAQVGVVLLPLMLFHQIQLIVCAFIARRMAQAADGPWTEEPA